MQQYCCTAHPACQVLASSPRHMSKPTQRAVRCTLICHIASVKQSCSLAAILTRLDVSMNVLQQVCACMHSDVSTHSFTATTVPYGARAMCARQLTMCLSVFAHCLTADSTTSEESQLWNNMLSPATARACHSSTQCVQDSILNSSGLCFQQSGVSQRAPALVQVKRKGL